MTEIAVEISRRTTPEIIKEQVRAKATEQSELLKGRAREMAMEKRDQVMREARHKRDEVIRGATKRSGLLSTIGALAGAAVGSFLVKKAIDKGEKFEDRSFHAGQGYGYYGPTERPRVQHATSYGNTGGYNTGYMEGTGYEAGAGYADSGYIADTGYVPPDPYVGVAEIDYGSSGFEGAESSGGGIGEKIGGAKATAGELRMKASGKLDSAKASVGEKVSDVKEMASEKFDHAKASVTEKLSHARERVSDVKHRASDRSGELANPQRMRQAKDWSVHSAEEHPLAFAVAAFGLGMLASSFLPVTQKERQLIEPAKERARHQMHELQGKMERKISGVAQAFGADTSSDEQQEEEVGSSGLILTEDQTPSLH